MSKYHVEGGWSGMGEVTVEETGVVLLTAVEMFVTGGGSDEDGVVQQWKEYLGSCAQGFFVHMTHDSQVGALVRGDEVSDIEGWHRMARGAAGQVAYWVKPVRRPWD